MIKDGMSVGFDGGGNGVGLISSVDVWRKGIMREAGSILYEGLR